MSFNARNVPSNIVSSEDLLQPTYPYILTGFYWAVLGLSVVLQADSEDCRCADLSESSIGASVLRHIIHVMHTSCLFPFLDFIKSINPESANHNNCRLLCLLLVILKVISANNVDPDQTAPLGAV